MSYPTTGAPYDVPDLGLSADQEIRARALAGGREGEPIPDLIATCDCESYDCDGGCCGPGQCSCSTLSAEGGEGRG